MSSQCWRRGWFIGFFTAIVHTSITPVLVSVISKIGNYVAKCNTTATAITVTTVIKTIIGYRTAHFTGVAQNDTKRSTTTTAKSATPYLSRQSPFAVAIVLLINLLLLACQPQQLAGVQHHSYNSTYAHRRQFDQANHYQKSQSYSYALQQYITKCNSTHLSATNTTSSPSVSKKNLNKTKWSTTTNSSSSSSLQSNSSNPTKHNDLQIRWTNSPSDSYDHHHYYIVTPVLLLRPKSKNPVQSSSSSNEILQLQLDLVEHQSYIGPLPFPAHLELSLAPSFTEDQQHGQSHYQFLSPHFVFARQHLEQYKGKPITVEQRFSESNDHHQFINGNYTEFIQTISDGNESKQCQLLTAKSYSPIREIAHDYNERMTNVRSSRNDGIDPIQLSPSPPLPSSSSSTLSTIKATGSVTICSHGNMNGIITWMPYGQFLLEPMTPDRCQLTPIKTNDTTTTTTVQTFKGCQHKIRFLPLPSNVNANMIKDNIRKGNRRKKRSESLERIIEVLVVTDSTMHKFHGGLLKDYVFTLMAAVSHIFQHSSIGNEINLKLVRWIELTNEQQESKRQFSSSQSTLRWFCQWQHQNNYPSDDDPRHHDTAILLTRRDLCRNKVEVDEIESLYRSKPLLCDTLGLAHSGQVCDPESSCAIVEDNGLSAAFTIAHELGHVLGIPHDDEEKCKNYYATEEGAHELLKANKEKKHVMTRMIDFNSHIWTWSPCSKHFITKYLDSGHGYCLLDDNSASRDVVSDTGTIGGNHRRSFESTSHWMFVKLVDTFLRQFSSDSMWYKVNEQCRVAFDPGATVCPDMPTCRRLWCTQGKGQGCRTQHMPWADGTTCGPNMWCQKGECVSVDPKSMRTVHGGWGPWSHYSECSLPCGGGIRSSRRECDNPKPQNGGKFCLGKRIRYQSCNTQPCDPPVADIRAQQCAKFNGQTFSIPDVKAGVIWVPHYAGISEREKCKLYCADSRTDVSYQLKERVIDGTPCSPDSYDICVNGNCESAGCDGILYSNMQLDWCGVCGGDNSTCREMSGHYQPRSMSHGYNFVVTIPAGAAHIEVVKDGSTEDNWLAMRGDDHYLLNGNMVVNLYKRKWDYGGVTIEYSGTNNVNGYERINVTRPISRALHFEILSVGNLRSPSVHYRYVISSKNLTNDSPVYQWILRQEWTECNKLCQGEQQLKVVCISVSRSARNIVPDEHCASQPMPPTESRVCNLHCEVEWFVLKRGPCSARCGPGSRELSIICRKRLVKQGDGKEWFRVHKRHCLHGPDPPTSEPCNGTKCPVNYVWRYLDWSSCSVPGTCGEGNQTRPVQCIAITSDFGFTSSPNVEVVVNNEQCQVTLGAPIISQPCKVECPHWNISRWSECSVPCGRGEKTRSVVCMHGTSQITDVYCEMLQPKPDNRTWCDMPECIVTQSINSIEGKPMQEQTPRFSMENKFSIEVNQPTVLNVFTKEKILWVLGAWGPCHCDQERKTFVHTRLVKCIRRLSGIGQNQEIPDEYCKYYQPKEADIEQCHPDEKISFLGCPPSMLIRTLPNQQAVGNTSSSLGTNANENSTFSNTPMLVENTQLYTHVTHAKTVPSTTMATPLLLSTTSAELSVNLPPVSSVNINNQQPEIMSSQGESHNTAKSGISTYQTSTIIPVVSTTLMFTTVSSVVKFSSKNQAKSNAELSFEQNISTTQTPTLSSSSSSFVSTSIVVPPSSKARSNYVYQHWTEWSEWTSCTLPPGENCGNGTQWREAICTTGECNVSLKPAKQMRSCVILCGIFAWRTYQWSPCSAICGPGEQTRLVKCFDWTNSSAPEHFCDSNFKPNIKKTCHGLECKLEWRTGDWSECSQSCDTGVQHRSVTCHRVNRYGFVDPNPLLEPRLPLLNRHKRRHQDKHDTKNNTNKNKNKRSERPSRHRKRHNNEANYNYRQQQQQQLQQQQYQKNRFNQQWQWCDMESKPKSKQVCNLGQCLTPDMIDSYVWKPLQWQPCKLSCGNSTQKRKVRCISQRTLRPVANKLCDPHQKPEQERHCKRRECHLISCEDLRNRGRIWKDGKHKIWIQGAEIEVYCFGMADPSAPPTEYLALNQAADDNYSQLLQSSSGCTSSQNANSKVQESILYFHYVRFDITSMKLIMNDTRFATIYHSSHSITRPYGDQSHLFGFGQAMVQGCLEKNNIISTNNQQNSINHNKCHFGPGPEWPNGQSVQAMFSISLQNDLIVAPNTQWEPIGLASHLDVVHIEIHRNKKLPHKVIGYCRLVDGITSIEFTRTETWTNGKCQIGCQPVGGYIQLMIA